ncbi:relaxase/mobilization nuclease domain-containing protein [Anaeromassilibacillus senegalensis]|uniref:Relaxase/mobilization nuclease domain-containing protein n=1 Tax=Anaeromassilibacillus senegalensis TaxID=1673717 RepID=A0ABS9ML37_9FIRM|nr:relaxase/mobilization nuclease domain-containing protein [Anaeromassilibacillus senegalensis]MCG4611531.1 relaxase/mobilization nuclease domain-containing protein [Anaeromassilibacillus senegalensis]
MATTRIMPLHIGKGRTESRAISDIIDYVANPQKTDNGKLITSYGCDSRTADAEFLLAKRQYIAATGRVRGTDDVIAYHVRQSFRPGEITPEEANRLGIEFARRFTKGNHSFVVCTHIDKSHIHNHIIWSAVNMDCDRKFRNFWGSTRAVRRLSDTICIENGLSIVENPKPHGKSYNKWLGEQAKPSHREQLRVMIDRALEQKPADFDTLLQLLSEMGCEVSRRGKAIRLKAPGWKNVARMDDKLGAGYSETEIRAVLAGEKQHTPRKQPAPQAAPPRVNLLVDIQAKLQAGKGAGYARWAKVFNLKQMAQTLNCLSEHGLLDYADLETKTAETTAHYHELSDQIKAAEKRMAEIAVLRTHIVNYAKTRETYVAYRKAGYSRKFRQEHEEEILLHQAAKDAFNELNVKKLPTVKALQTEYAKLLADKKTAYAEYRQTRAAMRELLTVKNNVDRVLAMEQTEPQQKEKDHGQR